MKQKDHDIAEEASVSQTNGQKAERDEAVLVEEDKRVDAQEITSKDRGKLVALIIALVLLLIASFFLIKYFNQLSTDEGRQYLAAQIRAAGPWGWLILFGLQILQVVVALVPGEVVEVLAGVLYGPWIGTLIIVAGVVVASAAIFALVRKLGYPFVSKIVSQKDLDKFSWLKDANKLGLLVFLLFLCPGLPKDILSYIVPLTDMKMGRYLVLSTLGRIPGCLVLAFSGNELMTGNYKALIIIVGIALVIVIVAAIFRKQIMAALEKRSQK